MPPRVGSSTGARRSDKVFSITLTATGAIVAGNGLNRTDQREKIHEYSFRFLALGRPIGDFECDRLGGCAGVPERTIGSRRDAGRSAVLLRARHDCGPRGTGW